MSALAKFWEFLKNHWREVGLACLALGGFFIGRLTVKPLVQTEYKERVVYQDKIVEKIVTVEVEKVAKAETKIVYRDRTVTPDGTVTERTVEKTDTKEDTTKEASATTEREKIVYVDRAVEASRKEETPLKQNHISLLVGYDGRPAFIEGLNSRGVAGGLHYERRILNSPLFLGAWIVHTGSVGGSVGFEF